MRSPICLFGVLTIQHVVQSHETCEKLCYDVPSCVGRGSYCKTSNFPNVCFGMFFVVLCVQSLGLYWRDIAKTSMCFSPNDVTCPEAIPVDCPVEPTTTPIPDTCEAICSLTPTCAFGENSQGSWCKNYQTIPVCFGLYWRDAARTRTCYFPADPTCPENDPVLCG